MIPGEQCSECGGERFGHVPACARRPRLALVAHTAALEWWVQVDGRVLGLVTASGPRGHRTYRAVTAHGGRRVPPGRDGVWSQQAAVNALVRADAEALASPGRVVDLDEFTDPA